MKAAQENFTEALKIIASNDVDKDSRALPLLMEAIGSGLTDKNDEAQACAHAALILVRSDDFQKAYDNFKKAFTLRKDLPIDPNMELLLWNNAREVFGYLLCLFGQNAYDNNKFDRAMDLSRANFIPHPGASFIPHFFCVKF